MNITVLILTGVLLLNLLAPVAVYAAARTAARFNYEKHKRYQLAIFMVCVIAVIVLEGLIRFSGGSGSLMRNSSYAGTGIYAFVLITHIIGAVLTYALWAYQIIFSLRAYRTQLPGIRSGRHRTLAGVIFIGLIYTALSGAAIYVMTLDLF